MVNTNPSPHLLIIAPAWIGDMVMAQTLFKYLKANHPDIILDVLAPAWTVPLAERMPEVHSSLILPFGHGDLQLCKRRSFGKKLRGKYDQAIVLPGSFKSALIPWWAGIKSRTGWLGECRYGLLNDVRRLNKLHYPRLIDRYVALALPKRDLSLFSLEPYYPRLTVDQEQRERLVKQWNLDLSRPILALCPGAEYGPAKRWPATHFAEVAENMIAKGWQVWIFGGKGDTPHAEMITAQTKEGCVDLTGKTSLLEAVDLLSLAGAVVSNDSGLMHVAAALEKPLVVPYGSSSPNFTPPLASRVEILNLKLACSPCFERVCPLQHGKCLTDITPQQVLSALFKWIGHDANTDR